MSAGTKQHRQTPTQALHARIKELEARLEQATSAPNTAQEVERLTVALRDLAEHLSSVTEHAFSLGREDAGDLERFVARRRELTAAWGVFDGPAGVRFWGADHQWHQTFLAPSDTVYAWSETDARRLARLFAGQAPLPGEELDTSYLESQFIRVEAPAPVVEETPAVVTLAESPAAASAGARHAKPAPDQPSAWVAALQVLTTERLTLSDVDDALAVARECAAEAHAKAAPLDDEPAADPGISVPAPKDVPGYGESARRLDATVRDTSLAGLLDNDEDQELLTALGRSIPATTKPTAPESDAEATQVVDVAELRKLTGNDETQTIPIVAEAKPGPELAPEAEPEPMPEFVAPPMPTEPPRICPADHTIRVGTAVQFAKRAPQ